MILGMKMKILNGLGVEDEDGDEVELIEDGNGAGWLKMKRNVERKCEQRKIEILGSLVVLVVVMWWSIRWLCCGP